MPSGTREMSSVEDAREIVGPSGAWEILCHRLNVEGAREMSSAEGARALREASAQVVTREARAREGGAREVVGQGAEGASKFVGLRGTLRVLRS